MLLKWWVPGPTLVFSLTLWPPGCWVPLVHLPDWYDIVRVMDQCDFLQDVHVALIPLHYPENAGCAVYCHLFCEPALFLIVPLAWDRRESIYYAKGFITRTEFILICSRHSATPGKAAAVGAAACCVSGVYGPSSGSTWFPQGMAGEVSGTMTSITPRILPVFKTSSHLCPPSPRDKTLFQICDFCQKRRFQGPHLASPP